MNWIVIHGNPKDGFTYIGPFDSFSDALEFAEELENDWWVAQLEDSGRDMSQLHSVRSELH